MSPQVTAEKRLRHGRRADTFPASQIVYSLTDVELMLAGQRAEIAEAIEREGYKGPDQSHSGYYHHAARIARTT